MRGAVALALCAACGLAWGQAGATIRTETRLVLVDAVARGKHGQYLHDLAAKDFHVFEDGKEQAIGSFEFQGASSTARKAYLTLFFDDAHFDMGTSHDARQAAVRLIDAGTGENALVAVAGFGHSLYVTQNFTDNAAALKLALSAGKGIAPRQAVLTGYGVPDVLLALRSLAQQLAPLPGRKMVVFLSGGFRVTQAKEAELLAAMDACNHANVAIYAIDVNGMVRGSAGNTPTSQPGPRLPLAGSPAAIAQPVSIMERQQVLRTLSTGTGGFFVLNTNDLAGGLERIAQERSEYYLLGYTPPRELQPGSCHNLKVRVDRPGVEVRARTSYCDRKPLDLLAGRPEERALEGRAGEEGGATASLEASYFYVGPNTVRVHVAMEIPPGAMKIERTRSGYRATANVVGIAYAADGGVAARFSDTAAAELADQKELDAFRAAPYRYEKEFRMAAGQYTLKVAFGEGGKGEARLAIDAWDGRTLQLSALAVGRPAGRGQPAEEGIEALLEDRTPLVAKGVQVLPAGTRRFTRSDLVLVYGEAYGGGAATARIDLLDPQSGAVERALGELALEAAEPGRVGVPLGFALQMEPLAAGPHRLRVTVTDRAGASVARSADFEVR